MKRVTKILSLLLTTALFIGSREVTAFAETISGNQGTGEREGEIIVKGDEHGAESEEQQGVSENGTIQEGIPFNPVHHCNTKDFRQDTTTWSYIYFGSYPQSELTDSNMIAAIDKTIERYGIKEDVGADVWINGTKYRRISRDDTNDGGSEFNKMPACNGYRYFKWERIKWRVLQNDGSTLFVVADKAIDCKAYNDEQKSVTWEDCTIRNWLNESFYNTAFSSKEKSVIIEQDAVNENHLSSDIEGGNDTKDKIYLLSFIEAKNESYGFCSDKGIESISRRMEVSDYANTRGVRKSVSSTFENKCWWWLRSNGKTGYRAASIDYDGMINTDGFVVWISDEGVCPALHINLSSDAWSMKDDGSSGQNAAEKAENPSASIPSGTSVMKDTKLSLNCATVGADIYYTTDGTIPSVESALYTGEIIINRDMTVKAVAMCQNYQQSNVSEFSYKVLKSDSGEEEKKDGDNQLDGNQGNIKIQKLAIKAPSKKLAAGKKVKLTLNVTPQNATNKAAKWKTSNKKYATVDKNGKITLKKKGIGKKVTITATAKDGSGKKASIKVQIMRHAVKSIKMTAPKRTLKAGKTMTVKAVVKTTGKNTNKTLTWKSSNKKYATVSKKGKVTAKKAGKGKTVTITAASTDGSNKKAKVKIKIK